MRPINNLYVAFLALLARATNKELARVIQFQKVELEILRKHLPQRLRLDPQDRRRLLKYGKPLGASIKDVITIVTPRTFARWASGKTKSVDQAAKSGRPRTKEEIRALILKLARETGDGYTKILVI